MSIERSAGAVVFFRAGDKIEYLLIQSGWGKKHWGFPKGIIEKGEKPEETARREIKEETGLEVELIDGFKEWFKGFYRREGQNIMKIFTFYLAEAKSKEVKLSFESIDWSWLSYEEALERLTFDTSKEVLRKADRFLHKTVLRGL